MRAPEKNATQPIEDRLDSPTAEAFEPSAPDATPEEWRHSFWDSLVSFWGSGEPEQRPGSETFVQEEEEQRTDLQQRWRIDEWDFSAEHGYESEFEGRSEFEHGEFDRWL